MKSVRIHRYGNVDEVKIENSDMPTLKNENEVLVAVHAAGVNPIDWKACEGYLSSMGYHFPFSLGWDFSGVITQVGSQVKHFKKGDPVCGMIRFPEMAGTFSEYVLAPADQICLKPKTLDHIHAAAFPLVALTAWQALFEYGRLQSDQTVLIYAAGGAVGQCAVQFAKAKGAKVIASARGSAKEVLQSYGVDQFIDVDRDRIEVAGEVDVVLDPFSGENALKSFSLLKKKGYLVCLLREQQALIEQKAKENHITTTFMHVKPSGRDLSEIAHLIEKGRCRITVAKTFPLVQAKAALAMVREGGTSGKVVLQLSE